ncbi:restriction endonuclease subunit S [Mycoplasma nasistruthionis]|uniref:Restriction endonuclease subunit S n=1 Tax=Mycoplasma nasistruthionis TaxID=353852 RepID=A0A4Y6I5U9_9MOLU|nr:restriction endonuclease subunit S [Mycoplasma nasistruthionis]QCZ36713.1 restriction endonuclease subunit S [Mycoplasma nasistruthionis]QDF65005.1 restriction endonuclease subunit S [Mycoplasma nasistruthionis]
MWIKFQKTKRERERELDSLYLEFLEKAYIKFALPKLHQLGDFYSGLKNKNKNDFSDKFNSNYVSYLDVFNNLFITDIDFKKVNVQNGENQNRVDYGDLFFTVSSETFDETGMTSVYKRQTKDPVYLNSFCFGFRFKDLNKINLSFISHYFRSNEVRNKILKCVSGTTRFNLSKNELKNIEIFMPSIEVQNYLANILDKMYFMINQTLETLPLEIKLRKQQYEYYRDKLLTFKNNN